MQVRSAVSDRLEWMGSDVVPKHARRNLLPSTVEHLVVKYGEMWQSVGCQPGELGSVVTVHLKHENARKCDELIAFLDRHFHRYPTAEEQQWKWRRVAFERIREFTAATLGYSSGEQSLLFSAAYQQVTRDFVGQARCFDASVHIDDLYQALRNVWIMNSVQGMLAQDMRLTRSVFAYSLLYPYTDNFLDEPSVEPDRKHRFNQWIANRISNPTVPPTDDQYHALHRLFQMIEIEHPRAEWESVYQALLAIHNAQIRSLTQQNGSEKLSACELLEMSVCKGGTSVLAHGYLVNGLVSEEQADFLFGYGVVLQLLDDLQDLRRDIDAGHDTLFSHAVSREGNIDHVVLRLLGLIQRVLGQSSPIFEATDTATIFKAIRRNCVLLVLMAVAQHHRYCSHRMVKRLESISPVHFSYVRRFRAKVRRKYRGIQDRLFRERQVHSIWELLGPPSDSLWAIETKADS